MVVIQSSELVTPALPLERRTLYLSNIDHQVFFHVEWIMVYDSIDNPRDWIEKLRECLAKILVPYYFLAGSFKLNDENGRLEIDCNGAGVVFTRASMDATIAQLHNLRDPDPLFRKELITLPRNVESIQDLPLLTLQARKFQCGGIALGICASHVAMDGFSAYNFLHDYTKIVRGCQEFFPNPCPDRSRLLPRSPPHTSYDHKEMQRLTEIPPKVLFDPRSFSPELDHTNLAFKVLEFTAGMIQSLKNTVLGSQWIKRPSTFEVLAAHIWQARTKSMDHLAPGDPSKLFLVTSTRGKLDLPENFCGNAVVGASCVDATAGEIRRQSLAFCVDRVRRALASTGTEDYIRSQIDWCELHRGMIDIPGGTIITPWWKIPFQDLDFGFGRPSYVTPVVNDRAEFVVIVSNCKNDGGLGVFLAMEKERMPSLEANLLSCF
ncbi:BAHD family acyltransferase, clade V [Selaginella moellendorffii]|uniref:BAHD family acyltransferase, clade V n=2 Tax=Selaginella moellendorffii TaxID=88036 RepID=D8R799_SELML|nr:BAHD family acyltransferase, clade V [Selaginella moellendorffii]